MVEIPESYLADGLYCSFDGWQIELRAPRPDGDHLVYLDAATWVLLKAYAEKIWKPSPRESDPGRNL